LTPANTDNNKEIGNSGWIEFSDQNGGLKNKHPIQDDGSTQAAGMNLEKYDWKQFVLNTLHWLSSILD
jgi:hypothetical protein